jgi:indolepyruvate ferredoxin oxidoreductase alpha subunit
LPGKLVRGKLDGSLPAFGELTPDLVAAAFGSQAAGPQEAVGELPGRPPSLCKGCPHVDTFKAMLDATRSYPNAILFSDIGCYTLGCLPPFDAVHSCVDMGASISMAHGAAQAGLFPVLCTIGDSTFTHSGMTPLLGAAKADADMTVLILDNATVAMTGGQATMAAGNELIDLLRGLGVKEERLHVIEPLAKYHSQNVELIARAVNHRGLSVIVARRACIQIKKPGKAKAEAKKPAAVGASGE